MPAPFSFLHGRGLAPAICYMSCTCASLSSNWSNRRRMSSWTFRLPSGVSVAPDSHLIPSADPYPSPKKMPVLQASPCSLISPTCSYPAWRFVVLFLLGLALNRRGS